MKICRDCACENVCSIRHKLDECACNEAFFKVDAAKELTKLKSHIKHKSVRINSFDNLMIESSELINFIDERISDLTKHRSKCDGCHPSCSEEC